MDAFVCAPDDGWRYHPKQVEQFPDKINCVTLHLVGYILEYVEVINSSKYFDCSICHVSGPVNLLQFILALQHKRKHKRYMLP